MPSVMEFDTTKPCGTKTREKNRYTRKDIEKIAQSHNLPTKGVTMNKLCAQLKALANGSSKPMKKPTKPAKPAKSLKITKKPTKPSKQQKNEKEEKKSYDVSTALKVIIGHSLSEAPLNLIEDPEPFLAKYIKPTEWNSYGYTQIVHKSGASHKWVESLAGKRSLYECSNYRVKDVSNAISMYHGTSSNNLDSIRKGIKWDMGKGNLGAGFHLTFNPSEASSYSCYAAGRQKGKFGVIIEVLIHNAHKIFGHGAWTKGDVSGFYHDTDPRGLNQINVRTEVLSQMEVLRYHVFNLHHSTFRGGYPGEYPLTPCGKFMSNYYKYDLPYDESRPILS